MNLSGFYTSNPLSHELHFYKRLRKLESVVFLLQRLLKITLLQICYYLN